MVNVDNQGLTIGEFDNLNEEKPLENEFDNLKLRKLKKIKKLKNKIRK
ncbi:MAG: hypothetical protein ABIL47_07465 [candidate division WOR-3 bacterium]